MSQPISVATNRGVYTTVLQRTPYLASAKWKQQSLPARKTAKPAQPIRKHLCATSRGEALQEQSRALQAMLTAKIGKMKDELSKVQALPLTEIVIDLSTGRASEALRPTVDPPASESPPLRCNRQCP